MPKRATTLVIAVATGVIQLLATVSAAAAENPPTQLWNVTFSNGGQNQSFGTAIGPDGNPVVTGVSTLVSGVDYKIRTVKLDAATGNILWNVTFDSDGFGALAFGVAVGPDGHPVVAGYSGNSGGEFADLRVIKYDGATGAVLWTITYSTPNQDEVGNAVAIGSDGNPVATGGSCLTDLTSCNFRTIKYNGSNGAIIWNVVFDSGNDQGLESDEGWDVAVGADGHAVVTGVTCLEDRCVTRTIKYYGATGMILWNVTFSSGSQRFDGSIGAAIGGDGHPVVTGHSCLLDFSSCDSMTMKLDGASGAILWTVTFDASAVDLSTGVAVGIDGDPDRRGIFLYC